MYQKIFLYIVYEKCDTKYVDGLAEEINLNVKNNENNIKVINRKSNFIESRIDKNEHNYKILLERVNRLTHVQRTIKRQDNIEENNLNSSQENIQVLAHAENLSTLTDDIMKVKTLIMDKSKLDNGKESKLGFIDIDTLLPEKRTQSMNKPSVRCLTVNYIFCIRFCIT